jgi:hypothetical protein
VCLASAGYEFNEKIHVTHADQYGNGKAFNSTHSFSSEGYAAEAEVEGTTGSSEEQEETRSSHF